MPFAARFPLPTTFTITAFKETTSHPCDTSGAQFGADLERFARVCRTVKGLRGARLGAIGARTGAFQTMRYSEKLLQAGGVTVVTVDLSEMMGALASGAPPAILDWNNNYGTEVDKCVCTHRGNFPKTFIGDTPEISELDVLGTVIGREKCFGAVKGKVKAGNMTFFRVSSDDRAGTLKPDLGQGAFSDDPIPMNGGR
ncbi:MAG: hypothetical protein WCO04_14860 [Pseudomonadota bacterium]